MTAKRKTTGLSGSQIKFIRKELALSAEEFATLVGLRGTHRARTVYKWEGETTYPSGTTEKSIRDLAAKHKISLGNSSNWEGIDGA